MTCSKRSATGLSGSTDSSPCQGRLSSWRCCFSEDFFGCALDKKSILMLHNLIGLSQKIDAIKHKFVKQFLSTRIKQENRFAFCLVILHLARLTRKIFRHLVPKVNENVTKLLFAFTLFLKLKWINSCLNDCGFSEQFFATCHLLQVRICRMFCSLTLLLKSYCYFKSFKLKTFYNFLC